jgi:DMSO/TMAO reductase YedYZ molybdopterin-dependent catalytic subunit
MSFIYDYVLLHWHRHMMTPRLLASLLLLTIACLLQPADSRAQDTALVVTGDVQAPLSLTAKDLAAMPRATLTTSDGGRSTTFEGVWLHQILRRAGVPQGENLRGKALASYLLATARDGYQVLYSLAELDPAFQDSSVLLADSADGKPLPQTAAPFRLVAPKDKRGARSIRMLHRIEVVQLRK